MVQVKKCCPQINMIMIPVLHQTCFSWNQHVSFTKCMFVEFEPFLTFLNFEGCSQHRKRCPVFQTCWNRDLFLWKPHKCYWKARPFTEWYTHFIPTENDKKCSFPDSTIFQCTVPTKKYTFIAISNNIHWIFKWQPCPRNCFKLQNAKYQ